MKEEIIDKDLIEREKISVYGNAGQKLMSFISETLEQPTDAKIRRYLCTMGLSEILEAIKTMSK